MAGEQVTVDEILPYIGEFGRFQVLQEAFLSLILMAVTFPIYVVYFASLDSPWQCVTNSTICILNGTYSTNDLNYKDRCTMPRNEWEFTQPKEYSLVTQFDLYCDYSWLAQMSTSIYYLGWFLGGFFVGGIADRFGRKTVLAVCTVMRVLGGLLCAFSPDIWFLIGIRFLLGITIPGLDLQGYILATEMMGPRHRAIAGGIYWQFYNISYHILVLTAYFVRNWKLLFIICSAPYICIFAFFPFMPESVRWLHSQGNNEKAMTLLKKAARFNGRSIPEGIELAKADKDSKKKKQSIFTLFRTKESTFKVLTLCFGWIAGNMLYYGLNLASGGLGGDLYLNFFLVSVIEMPATVIQVYAVNAIGRKKTAISSMLLTGLACLLLIFIPFVVKWRILRVCIGVLGKLGACMFFATIYLWSTELYPTEIRATATSFLQGTAPVGGCAAPWIISYFKTKHEAAPFVAMGCIAILCSITSCRLTETKNKGTDEIRDETMENDPKRYTSQQNI